MTSIQAAQLQAIYDNLGNVSSKNYVFLGGMFHTSYITSANQTYGFYIKDYDANYVSFSSNIITFTKDADYTLTFFKGQINTSFNIRLVLNDITIYTFTFNDSGAIASYKFSVKENDNLLLKVDHSNTSTGWYDSCVIIY